jgi:hypothetical protein
VHERAQAHAERDVRAERYGWPLFRGIDEADECHASKDRSGRVNAASRFATAV